MPLVVLLCSASAAAGSFVGALLGDGVGMLLGAVVDTYIGVCIHTLSRSSCERLVYPSTHSQWYVDSTSPPVLDHPQWATHFP